jgi:pimeloyl-ACP methyl ester carboxylesterase
MSCTSRPLVVLLHGTRDNGSSFEQVAAALADTAGLDVIAYDRRGWGENPIEAEWSAKLADHTEDLLTVIGSHPATVIGHSWGGNVAIAAAIRRPDLVASVGLWETGLPWAPWWPGDHARMIRGAIDSVKGKPPGSARQNRDRQGFVAEATESLSQQYELAGFTVPCIIGYGMATVPSFRNGMHALARETGAELYSLSEATQMAHREVPEDFTRFVRRAVALGRRRRNRSLTQTDPLTRTTSRPVRRPGQAG